MLYFIQQDAVTQAAQDAAEVSEEKTLSIFDLLLSGGIAGQIIVIVCSGLYLF